MITLHKEVLSERWSWDKPILTLKCDDYVCPFCSHEGSIELHRAGKKAVWAEGFDYKYYLSCLGGCMSYDLLRISAPYLEDSMDEQAVIKAEQVFSKMILFSSNFKDYKKGIDFIL